MLFTPEALFFKGVAAGNGPFALGPGFRLLNGVAAPG